MFHPTVQRFLQISRIGRVQSMDDTSYASRGDIYEPPDDRKCFYVSTGNSNERGSAVHADWASYPVSWRCMNYATCEPYARSLFSRRSLLPAVTSIAWEWPTMRQLSVHRVPFRLSNDVTLVYWPSLRATLQGCEQLRETTFEDRPAILLLLFHVVVVIWGFDLWFGIGAVFG